MARLRRADCSGPGITRRRAGAASPTTTTRASASTSPRCSSASASSASRRRGRTSGSARIPNGHLQATGIDAAGPQAVPLPRRLAHPPRRGEVRRHDRASPTRCRSCASRSRPTSPPRTQLTRERVLACAVRLLDRGFFRIGTEEYTNESFGLATIRKEHVRSTTGTMVFDYPAKSGKRRVQARRRPAGDGHRRARSSAAAAAGRSCSPTRPAARWYDLRSDDINAYLKEATGDDFSAKDFRTWSATVLAARRAGRLRPGPRHQDRHASARSRARSRRPRTTWATRPRCAARPTSTRASSTPTAAAWCSTSDVIAEALTPSPASCPTHHPQIERAVLDLLDEREDRAAASSRSRPRPSAGSWPLQVSSGCGGGGSSGRRRLAVRRRVGRDDRLLGHGGRGRLGRGDRAWPARPAAGLRGRVMRPPSFPIRRRRASPARSG